MSGVGILCRCCGDVECDDYTLYDACAECDEPWPSFWHVAADGFTGELDDFNGVWLIARDPLHWGWTPTMPANSRCPGVGEDLLNPGPCNGGQVRWHLFNFVGTLGGQDEWVVSLGNQTSPVAGGPDNVQWRLGQGVLLDCFGPNTFQLFAGATSCGLIVEDDLPATITLRPACL